MKHLIVLLIMMMFFSSCASLNLNPKQEDSTYCCQYIMIGDKLLDVNKYDMIKVVQVAERGALIVSRNGEEAVAFTFVYNQDFVDDLKRWIKDQCGVYKVKLAVAQATTSSF